MVLRACLAAAVNAASQLPPVTVVGYLSHGRLCVRVLPNCPCVMADRSDQLHSLPDYGLFGFLFPSAAVQRSAVAFGKKTKALPNDISNSWHLAGFLCSRNPRSVALSHVVVIVRSIGVSRRGRSLWQSVPSVQPQKWRSEVIRGNHGA